MRLLQNFILGFIFVSLICANIYESKIKNKITSNLKKSSLSILPLLNEREGFTFIPTPLQRLNNLSKMYPDYNLYIKRDDLTGLAFGGTKARKLDSIIHHAKKKGVEVMITEGTLQSNAARQTAAACRISGLECYLFLYGNKNLTESQLNGNLRLDYLLGANVIISDNKEELFSKIDELKIKLESENRKYLLTPGGDYDEYGLLGYVNLFKEILTQEEQMGIKFDYIIHASASLETQTGIVLGKKIFNANHKIIGIGVTKFFLGELFYNKPIFELVKEMTDRFSRKFGLNIELNSEDVIFDKRFMGGKDYEKMGLFEKNAIETFALNEGIIVDPVYTSRSGGAMLNMLQNKEIPEGSNVLFIHTGGTPIIFSDIFKMNLNQTDEEL
jgi:1-aminocyclopropane-1-carboxylate deaminase/D-cysteine desulfhydrase-like pyridoxal-dependent ACC family enzyme